MDTQLPAMAIGLPHRGLPEDLARHGKEDQAVWNRTFAYVGRRPSDCSGVATAVTGIAD
ncbi:hypothetical protein V3C33_17805 [Micrococcaceae bacterium Sec5.7]